MANGHIYDWRQHEKTRFEKLDARRRRPQAGWRTGGCNMKSASLAQHAAAQSSENGEKEKQYQ